MESLTKNKQSIETLTRLVKAQFNEVVAQIEELKEGWFNVAYNIRFHSGKEVILKIAPNPDVPVMTYEKDMMRSEVIHMKEVWSMGIGCPEVLFYDDSKTLCNSDYFFMEKLRGHNLEYVKEKLSKEDLKHIHHTIGKWTKLWNTPTDYPFFGYIQNPDLQAETWKEAFTKMLHAVLNDGLAHHVDIGVPYPTITDTLEQFGYTLDEVKEPHFVHWDLWDSNVFIDENKVSGVLDFERGFYGDPLAEALFRMCHPDQLEGYGKTTFTHSESIRMGLYDIYLYLIMMIEDSYRYYETKDIYHYGLSQLKRALQTLNDLKENKGESSN